MKILWTATYKWGGHNEDFGHLYVRPDKTRTADAAGYWRCEVCTNIRQSIARAKRRWT